MPDPRISGDLSTSAQALRMLEKAAAAEEIEQVESAEDLQQWFDLEAFNPLAMTRRFRSLQEIKGSEPSQIKKERLEEKKVMEVEKVEEAAARFQRNNFELQAKILLILRSKITAQDTPEDVLTKVLEMYPDYSLADEALDFLLATADSATEPSIREAKEKFNSQFAREIVAGRNINAQAQAFSKQGLGSPSSLRDLYRDITGTQREPIKLFDELSDKFSYENLRTAIHFLFHSLGADLRSKGPSIPRPELMRLIDETRDLQGVLGVYRFFKERMPSISRQFSAYQIDFPADLRFERISKQFVHLLADRFASPDKILQSTQPLGIFDEAIAQLVVLTVMRDAVKQIAPRFYRNPQQRDELFQAFLKTLEELEEELAEEEEEETNREKKKKKK